MNTIINDLNIKKESQNEEEEKQETKDLKEEKIIDPLLSEFYSEVNKPFFSKYFQINIIMFSRSNRVNLLKIKQKQI
jgi:hypothetical protein